MFIQSRGAVYAARGRGSHPLAYKRVASCLKLQSFRCRIPQRTPAHPAPGTAWLYFGVIAGRRIIGKGHEQHSLCE
jgi:hypothetical protein